MAEDSVRKHKPAPKDIFDILSALGPALLALMGVIFTGMVNRHLDALHTESISTSMMTERESAELQFRKDMFKELLDRLLDDRTDLETRIAVFGLFEQNFHDSFNGRGLFDLLDRRVHAEASRKGVEVTRLRGELGSIAADVRKSEEDIVVADAMGDPGMSDRKLALMTSYPMRRDTTIAVGNSVHLAISLLGEDKHDVTVRLVRMDPDSGARVTLEFRERPGSVPEVGSFWVGYFDTPFADNTMLPEGHRLALMLESRIGDGSMNSARIRLLEFPSDIVVSGYRPSLRYVRRMISEVGGKGNKD